MQKTDKVIFIAMMKLVIAQTLSIILNQAGFKASAFDHPEKPLLSLLS